MGITSAVGHLSLKLRGEVGLVIQKGLDIYVRQGVAT